MRDLARSAGLAPSYVSMFERGEAYPSPARLNAIARTLGVTLGDLLGSTEEQAAALSSAGGPAE